jgi:hypothetical protein
MLSVSDARKLLSSPLTELVSNYLEAPPEGRKIVDLLVEHLAKLGKS